ncbi:hypothetical protein [uncultured Ruegeria sp.]|uniref:DUF6950 family protein n=1 Tax=uncultured Ruegeria sp. TaxID=259304 RepID=UPI002624A17C|nr:hypothetical protein [uncultured Ruegeria sp.]
MRLEDWPLRLDRLISEARDKPFEWGTHDCGTFAADVVETLTGVRLPLPKGYTTARGSMLAMRRKTGSSQMDGAVSYFLGEPLESPLLAQRGDIVLHETQALGVCVGQSAMCLSEAGLASVSVNECVKVWRV